jgi:AcrR family transcriptional regulator
MPPKVSFTREKVLDCAFDIVRKDGLNALSARRIAEELQCSTRPVYATFGSMKALQESTIQRARDYAVDYFLRDAEDTDSPFLALGLRYFRFSQEERELFKLLYMEGKMGGTFGKMGEHFSPLLDRMKEDYRLYGLSEADLKQIGTDSWIYTHGLITLIYAIQPERPEELITVYLRRMGRMLMGWGHDRGTAP